MINKVKAKSFLAGQSESSRAVKIGNYLARSGSQSELRIRLVLLVCNRVAARLVTRDPDRELDILTVCDSD